MKFIKIIKYYYSNFKDISGRIEYSIYFVIDVIANFLIYFLKQNASINDKSVINLFCIWIILNVTFVPIQAVTTRRLRDVGIKESIIIINFIPIINIVFRIFLLFKKGKKL